MQVNFNNFKHLMGGHDVDQVCYLVTKGCQAKTRARVMSILTYDKSRLPSFGIFERLIKDDDGVWRYIAGQSYTEEIKLVRELILKGT